MQTTSLLHGKGTRSRCSQRINFLSNVQGRWSRLAFFRGDLVLPMNSYKTSLIESPQLSLSLTFSFFLSRSLCLSSSFDVIGGSFTPCVRRFGKNLHIVKKLGKLGFHPVKLGFFLFSFCTYLRHKNSFSILKS